MYSENTDPSTGAQERGSCHMEASGFTGSEMGAPHEQRLPPARRAHMQGNTAPPPPPPPRQRVCSTYCLGFRPLGKKYKIH